MSLYDHLICHSELSLVSDNVSSAAKNSTLQVMKNISEAESGYQWGKGSVNSLLLVIIWFTDLPKNGLLGFYGTLTSIILMDFDSLEMKSLDKFNGLKPSEPNTALIFVLSQSWLALMVLFTSTN